MLWNRSSTTKYFRKNSWKLVVHIFTLLLAPFAPKLVNYLRRLKINKSLSSKEFFRLFKDSLCRKWLTNLDAKGAKRSLKMWNTSFCKSFFKNIALKMNGGLSKIRSVHTYVMRRTGYFGCICKSSFWRHCNYEKLTTINSGLYESTAWKNLFWTVW